MTEVNDIKILVCEDDVYFQKVLQKRLKSEGYQVLTAGDGRDGMKLIVAEDPDLVISDWMMPHVDGLELCQSVKTGLGSGAPYFILLTAKGEISDRLLALETGADDYLVKPCDQGELMSRVRAGLRNVELARKVRHMERELQAARSELETAQSDVNRLVRMVPRCQECAKVSTARGDWIALERYLEQHAQIAFRPDVCPACDESDGGALDEDEASAA